MSSLYALEHIVPFMIGLSDDLISAPEIKNMKSNLVRHPKDFKLRLSPK